MTGLVPDDTRSAEPPRQTTWFYEEMPDIRGKAEAAGTGTDVPLKWLPRYDGELVEVERMSGAWRPALMRLHVAGWDTDDIDAACEALGEACTEGAFEGTAVVELTPDQVCSVLGSTLPAGEIAALLEIADLRSHAGGEADTLRAVLYDLDAFAYEYAGDD